MGKPNNERMNHKKNIHRSRNFQPKNIPPKKASVNENCREEKNIGQAAEQDLVILPRGT